MLNIINLETDPYVTIKCEGETVKSSVVENSLNPEFNFSAIFYRKDPDKDILVQVCKIKFYYGIMIS